MLPQVLFPFSRTDCSLQALICTRHESRLRTQDKQRCLLRCFFTKIFFFLIKEGMIFFPNRSCFFLFSFVFTKTNKQNHPILADFELSLGFFFLEDKNYATLVGYMPVSLLGRR